MTAGESPPVKWADLGIRAASAAILVPFVLLDVWAGGGWFRLMVALLAVLMAYEWTAIVHRSSPTQFALHAAAAIAGAVIPEDSGATIAITAIIVLTLLGAGVTRFKGTPLTLWSISGIPYVGLSAVALVVLRDGGALGVWAVLWVMAIVWSADTFAYFAGRILGGPKLAPAISPKKTWAGLGGAMAGAAAASLIFTAAAGLGAGAILAFIALGLALVEQAGDLFKSAMKRQYGVKDTGHLIPGHGGVIDRVDGLVAVAMAAAVLGSFRAGTPSAATGVLAW
ncbi:MAG: phosphatidate cytidylyltransferase [Aestuariivirga sp.]